MKPAGLANAKVLIYVSDARKGWSLDQPFLYRYIKFAHAGNKQINYYWLAGTLFLFAAAAAALFSFIAARLPKAYPAINPQVKRKNATIAMITPAETYIFRITTAPPPF